MIGLLFYFIASKKWLYRLLSYALILSGPIFFKDFLPYYFPLFLLGICIFLYKSQLIYISEFILISGLTMAVILLFHDPAVAIATCLTYSSILFFTKFNNKLFHFLGNISYSVYLFHGLVGTTMLNYFSHTVKNPFYKSLLLLMALITTIVAAYIVFKGVELPSKKLSSRIKFKKT